MASEHWLINDKYTEQRSGQKRIEILPQKLVLAFYILWILQLLITWSLIRSIFFFRKYFLTHIHDLLNENVVIGPRLTLKLHIVMRGQNCLINWNFSLWVIIYECIRVFRQSIEVSLLLSQQDCLIMHLS